MCGRNVVLLAALAGGLVAGTVQAGDLPAAAVTAPSDELWTCEDWFADPAVDLPYGETAQPCFDNGDCGGRWYCAKAVGDCDGVGECRRRPRACIDLWDPVCGCDGNTYSNSCYAAAAGVSVDYYGECIMVGCMDNSQCAPAEFCAKAVGDCDGVGQCSVRPEICLDVWIPVCGCDGNTYSNDCYAARVGVNVAYDGHCAAPVPTDE